ncbi:MAG: NUDIX domain-containing protein [Flavobacteriales bacterium]
MGRKYKFFIKQKAVIFKQDAGFGNDNTSIKDREPDQGIVGLWSERFKNMEVDRDVEISVADIEFVVNGLFQDLQVITAAGGYVQNEHGQLLMIFRRGHWDLPKGKMDEGETTEQCAIREVEEECGISGLQITSEPYSTFHVYEERGEVIVKESVWYRMKCSDSKNLVPQTEEDIEQALWLDLPIKKEIRDGAYGSIREVLDHFA